MAIKIKFRPFAHVSSYTIYYGYPTEQAMRELSGKDLAIVEPTAYTKEQIAQLRSAGTLVIGYISVMESPTWNTSRMERLNPGDYLLQSGERVHFAKWDSYLMDLRRSSYKQLLLREIEASIAAKSLDGVFFDTVGDIDDYIGDPKLQAELREAYKGLLQDVTQFHPGLAILQNRGFDTLDAAISHIHGLVWEDWRRDWEHDAWTRARVMRLVNERSRGLQVFTVSHNSDPANAIAAGRLKFVHLNAPNGFTAAVN